MRFLEKDSQYMKNSLQTSSNVSKNWTPQFLGNGAEKLVTRYKCLDCNGNSVKITFSLFKYNFFVYFWVRKKLFAILRLKRPSYLLLNIITSFCDFYENYTYIHNIISEMEKNKINDLILLNILKFLWLINPFVKNENKWNINLSGWDS